MRLVAAVCALAVVVCLAVFGAVLAQKATQPATPPATARVTPPPRTIALADHDVVAPPVVTSTVSERPVVAPPPVMPPAAAPPSPTTETSVAPSPYLQVAQAPGFPAPAPTPAATTTTCAGNPNALGLSRVVEVDTTGGPGFGFEHFKSHDFLRPGEVVLTFDDGPWPKNTPAVLAALAAHCTKAIFFPIGKHTTYSPEILRQVAAAGHTIGSHTWSHADLSKKPLQEGKDEIEKGISAVHWAIGGAESPFFRFPALRHPPELVTYLGTRNIAIFSTDMDSFDFKLRKPEQVVQSVMSRLKKNGKGIVLMHDFQRHTAEAAMTLLNQLQAGGYKIVLMKAKDPLKTIPSYDEAVLKDQKLPTVSDRPTTSVIRTISE
jgi:peptidoglycan/xylan/chitin deacetylase (PgdA/CDA1 family)